MKRTNLVDLMQRYITGQVTAEEKKKIEAWLDVKKTDDGRDMLLSPEDEERLFRQLTSSIENAEGIKAFRPAARSSKRWLAIAASLIVLIMSAYTVWFFSSHTGDHQTITTTQAEKTILDDGSIVWLRKASRLTYGNYDDVRQATFSGEALFEVAKDPRKPFTVTCGPVTVQVVGTSFNIKSAGDVFELKVLTGKVRLYTSYDPDGTLVNANEIAVYTPSGGVSKTAINEEQIAAVVSDTDYSMAFRNAAMEDVLAKIRSKFNISVDVADPALKACRITANFTDNSLQATMETLSELLDIEFTITPDRVKISGKGCK